METKVTINQKSLLSIISLPIWSENNICHLDVGDRLEVTGISTRTDDGVDFLQLQIADEYVYLRADLFDFDVEAYKAELEVEERRKEQVKLKEKLKLESKKFLEHYDWNGLRCKAAVAAMQGFIANGMDDHGDPERNTKLLISTSVKIATALVEELKATV